MQNNYAISCLILQTFYNHYVDYYVYYIKIYITLHRLFTIFINSQNRSIHVYRHIYVIVYKKFEYMCM